MLRLLAATEHGRRALRRSSFGVERVPSDWTALHRSSHCIDLGQRALALSKNCCASEDD